jgi:exodeoxyribonuclease VII small subunit
MSKNKEENITFEQAIEELETIINRLEEGDVPLDETINLYEKGSELKDFCEKKLQSAEIKIQKINQKTKTKEITLEDYK